MINKANRAAFEKKDIASDFVKNPRGVDSLVAPELKVRDPLSDVTRKERRSLLGISGIGLIIVNVGLLPAKINALGIEFDSPNKQTLLRFLALIILYYLIAFVIYAASDFITWRSAFIAEYKKAISQEEDQGGYTDERANDIIAMEKYWRSLSTPTSIIRSVFEFIVPIVISGFSIISLFLYKTMP